MKLQFKRLFAITSTALFLFSSLTIQADDLKAKVDSIVNRYIEEGYTVGAVVGVFKKDKTSVWPYGSIKKGTSQKPNGNTLYEIGSISKVFTGIVLASLVNEGIVKFDDPISKYVTELADAPTGNITLIELSTHTSGLPRMPNNFSPANPNDPYADYTEQKLLEFLKGYVLGARPVPFSWKNYSNLGVGLLGYTLTRATGLSYSELIYEKITGPLKMHDTVIELNEEQQKRFATPYDTILDQAYPWDLNVLAPAGGIRSTALDLMIFAKANLYPDSTPIADSLKLAQQVHRKNNVDKIGLGWGITSTPQGTIVGHNGGTGGYRAEIGFVQGGDTGVAILTNSANRIDSVATLVLRNIEREPDFGFPVSRKILDEYAGTYKHKSGITFKIYRNKNSLIYELVGQEKHRLYAVSKTKFRLWNIATWEFKRDEEGNVTHFVFTQGEFTGDFIRQEQPLINLSGKSILY